MISNKLFYQIIFILFFAHDTSMQAVSYIINNAKKRINWGTVDDTRGVYQYLPAGKKATIKDAELQRWDTLEIVDIADGAVKKIAAAPLQDNTTYVFQDEKLYNEKEAAIKAVRYGKMNQIESLIKHDINLNVADEYGTNLLMFAIIENHKKIFDLLLLQQKDIQINKPSKDGTTPLILAAKRGRQDMVQLLLNYGADVTIKDNKGNTALDYAQDKNHQSIVNKLIRHTPKKSARAIKVS